MDIAKVKRMFDYWKLLSVVIVFSVLTKWSLSNVHFIMCIISVTYLREGYSQYVHKV